MINLVLGIDLANSLLVHELVIVCGPAPSNVVMLDYRDHLFILGLLRPIERSDRLADAVLIVVLTAVIRRTPHILIHHQALTIAVVAASKHSLKRLIDFLLFLLFLILKHQVLVALGCLSDRDTSELRQHHVLLIDLLRVSNGAHGDDGLSTPVSPIVVNG